MFVAKLTATVGLALFLAGAVGAGGSSAIVTGCLLLLVAAVSGAVALEGRDFELAAGLLPPEFHEPSLEAAPSEPAELPTAA